MQTEAEKMQAWVDGLTLIREAFPDTILGFTDRQMLVTTLIRMTHN